MSQAWWSVSRPIRSLPQTAKMQMGQGNWQAQKAQAMCDACVVGVYTCTKSDMQWQEWVPLNQENQKHAHNQRQGTKASKAEGRSIDQGGRKRSEERRKGRALKARVANGSGMKRRWGASKECRATQSNARVWRELWGQAEEEQRDKK